MAKNPRTGFLKKCFMDYAITVVPIFPPLLPSTQHCLLPQATPIPLFMSMGRVYRFCGCSIPYAALDIPVAML